MIKPQQTKTRHDMVMTPLDFERGGSTLIIGSTRLRCQEKNGVNRAFVREWSASPADRVHQPLGLDEPGGVDLVPFPLAATLSRRAPAISASEAPARSKARMSVSSRAKRQLRSLPSAVRRTRLQLPQKGRLMEAIRPTRPPPSSEVVIDGRGPRVLVGGRGERTDPGGEQVEDLGRESTLPRSQRSPASSGMYSMNRSSSPCSRANWASGTTSSSVTPLMRDGVDLDRVEPGRLGGEDALDHLLQAGRGGSARGTRPGPSCRG